MVFKDDLVEAVRSAACSYVQGIGAANNWLQSIIPTTPDPPFEAGLNGLLCGDPTTPPQSQPPATGGQCPGVAYNLGVFRTPCGSSTESRTSGFTLTGPISVSSWSDAGPIGGQPTCRNWTSQINSSGTNPNPVPQQIASETAPSWDIVRIDGNPDNCGNQSPVIPPFEPPVITVPIPDPGGGPDIDVDVTLYAPIIVGPNVFAPVRIEGPNFDIDAQINFRPDVSIDVGLGGVGGGGGVPVESEPDDDYDPESPDEPAGADGRRIIGLIVTLSVDSTVKATELIQDGDVGSILVPRIAIAYLVSNNGGVRVPLSGVDLKLRNTYIPVPPDVEVVSWRIHTEPGVTVQSVRPVYGTTRPAT